MAQSIYMSYVTHMLGVRWRGWHMYMY